MSYKPKTLKSDYVRGPSGVAKIALSPDKKKAKVVFKEDDKTVIVSEFPKETKPGNWFISLDKDEKKIMGIRPASGVFTATVQKFTAREGEQPAPQTKIGPDWNYQYFVVLLELITPEVKGMIVPVMLRYHFGEAMEDEKSVVAFSHPKSKYTPLLAEFCDVTGVWARGAMAYKDNILPMLEKRVLREAKKFQVVIKDGYVDSFLELSEPITETMPEEEFTPTEEQLPEDEG